MPTLSNAEITRYSRHLLLDEVGLAGQERLKGASVLCVGAGGLGSPLLLYLAAAGVGRIGLVDFDVVDVSNLQRQVLHGTSQIGQPKVLSARARLLDLNPHVQVDLYEEPLTSGNALQVLAPYDVIVDGTDNFPTRYLINDACVLLGKPNVYGSIFKFEGQASVFNYQGGPNYRDLYPEPPPPGLVPSCAEGGVLGVLPGVIGGIQATETLKILLGRGTTLSGRLLLYDALGMRFTELSLRKDPHAKPITHLVDYDQLCGVVSPVQPHHALVDADTFVDLHPTEVVARRAAGWAPYVLDVRSEAEARIASLAFTDRLYPHSRVLDLVDELPRDRDLLVVCKVGGRSAMVCEVLAAAGFSRLFNLDGGVVEWALTVDPEMAIY